MAIVFIYKMKWARASLNKLLYNSGLIFVIRIRNNSLTFFFHLSISSIQSLKYTNDFNEFNK